MIKIYEKVDCCGCSACFNICNRNAIRMVADKEGFEYPKVNDKDCINCGRCEKVCPVICRKNIDLGQKNYKDLHALRHKNESILASSSSGGAFFAIAEYVVSNGGYVIGAAYSDDMVVQHVVASTLEECAKLQGSKYSQSDAKDVFPKIKDLLKEGKMVLFTGTPCQVDGLRNYLSKPYDTLITMDVVCHAVPSPMIFREYVDYVSRKIGKRLKNIAMRDKRIYGWSHRFSYRYDFHNNTSIYDSPKVENWGRLFFSRLIDRPSCHDCRYTNLFRPGDITVADFWDDDNLRPDIKSTKGTSLFIVNSDNGIKVLEAICPKLEVWAITEQEAMQPCLIHPTTVNPKRKDFWEYYNEKGFDAAYNRFFKNSILKRIKRHLRSLLKRKKF